MKILLFSSSTRARASVGGELGVGVLVLAAMWTGSWPDIAASPARGAGSVFRAVWAALTLKKASATMAKVMRRYQGSLLLAS